jgi:tetratricopeptide (TPR) repeat protein
MIEAMAKRYANPDVADRWPFEEAYSNAMSALAKDRPDDPDIVTLAAESLMVLRAKAFRDTESKRHAPDYGHVLKALAIVLRGCPNHPLALHLWVHALDASPFPEKAAGAADSLRTLAPAIGHLVHMASHIDVRLGRWHRAVLTNEKAIAADHAYRRMEPGPGSHLPSMLHSQHMLAYAAMMEGQSKKAALSVEQLLSRIPEPQFDRRPQDVDVFVAMPYEVHMRFGQWDAMIAEPRPAERFPFAKAMWHFARGVAFAAKHEVTAAKGEQKAFIAAREDVPKDLRFRTLRVAPLLDIAERLLAGEILYRERNVDQAVEALRQGVKREDELDYVEPPLWVVPVRHALGAALMDSGRCTEAEVVYREDLVQHPENGWALYGLARSLQKQGKHAETALVRSRFETAWQHADFKLSSSCCCLPEGRAADQSDER